ncbi:MAG: glycosyltransferase family 4 protein [Oceanospirillaceae bacterium]|nr:glycosyltransferase family 4 protein [Oceanospirillaceae bacterium]
MKIVHVCLSCFYIDGYSYQENMLVKEHVNAGHQVKVLASTENYIDGQITYVKPSVYIGSDGAEVTRLSYRKLLPQKLMTKLRMHAGVYDYLAKFSPDVIVFHGLCGWELRTVCKYKVDNPTVRLWVDSHEDHNNSARNFSSSMLHKFYYKPIIKSVREILGSVLCISLETMDFVEKMYGLDRKELIFYPLGAQIQCHNTYTAARSEFRRKLGIKDHEYLIVQAGKQTPRKRLVDSLSAFTKVSSKRLRFVVAGVLDENLQTKCLKMIESDSRIEFLGWQNSNDLQKLLCAADVYLQPGTQSATMQASLGACCAVILDRVHSHEPFVDGNGWFVEVENDIWEVFREISELEREDLNKMQSKSQNIAKELLDYKVLAKFLLN